MANTLHPSGVVRRHRMEPLGQTITVVDSGLGATRQAVSDLVNERADLSVEMVLRLSKTFGLSEETLLGCRRRTNCGRRATAWRS